MERFAVDILVRIAVRAAMTTSPWVPTVGHLLKGGKTPYSCWEDNVEGGDKAVQESLQMSQQSLLDTVRQKIDTECVLLYSSCTLMPDVPLLASDE